MTSVQLQRRTGGGAAELDDYSLSFSSCKTQHFWFAHIASLSAGLTTSIGALGGSCNAPYQTGGFIYCYQFTNRSPRVFVQLVSASTLKIQVAGTGACGDPASWSFGGTAVTYSR